ncbi:hypothetical protein DEU37_1132 [Microbacterium sp. AG790]|uniref:hypothetical protein n=1 Tax=Microbacterium sp. AG790 TaxID=2183995 RepID=UPI000F136AF3|nr:hypothetical protein [Microbacterium sp. AG790]RKS93712.1 hypothetical protein DEU37_1132 [Microbacterium sp. AG790]
MPIISAKDLEGLPDSVRLVARIGLIANEGAQIEHALAEVVATLSRTRSKDGHKAVARRSFADKVALLDLLWPARWPSPKTLLDALRQVADYRNQHAHSYGVIDWEYYQKQENLPPLQELDDYVWVLRNNRNSRNTRPDDQALVQALELNSAVSECLFHLVIGSAAEVEATQHADYRDFVVAGLELLDKYAK